MSNSIEKQIKLKAPIGKVTSGHITYPGYQHIKWEVVVQKIEPMRLFLSVGILIHIRLTLFLRVPYKG